MMHLNRILLAVLLLLFSFTLTSCIFGDSGTPDPILKGDRKSGVYTWTIMVYLDGDNNLEEFALEDLNEMELVDLGNEGVNVIVLIDRSGGYTTADGNWSGTRLYRVVKDADTGVINSQRLSDSTYLNLTDTGDSEELDMGDTSTVTGFISFCKSAYPANKYAFIFWNHGDGWRSESSISFTADTSSVPVTESGVTRAVCLDNTDNNYLTMSEVKLALSEKGIDIIGFDACLMSMVEVVYELKDTGAEYVVASAELEPGEGWVYDMFLYKLIKLIDNSSLNTAKVMVDSYIDYTPYSGITLSVTNLAAVDALVSPINTLSAALSTQAASDAAPITNALSITLAYGEPSYIDLYDFVQNLSTVPGASDVITALSSAVVYHRHRNLPDSHGLSIYFPESEADSYYSDYNSFVIDFPGAVSWDEFLADYFAND